MDILYILGNGSRWKNKELRFSLRSVARYAQNVDRVFVVGDNPGFLSNEVIFHRVPEAIGNKEYRIAAKIRWACQNTDLSPEFWFLNDDHILLKSVNADGYPYYYRCDLKSMTRIQKPKLSPYQDSLKRTEEYLSMLGYPTLNYDIHVPIRYKRDEFLALEPHFEKSKTLRNGFVVKSIYSNIVENTTPKVQLNDCKIGRARGPHDVESRVKSRHVFSFADSGLIRGVARFLGDKFPIQSKYEK